MVGGGGCGGVAAILKALQENIHSWVHKVLRGGQLFFCLLRLSFFQVTAAGDECSFHNRPLVRAFLLFVRKNKTKNNVQFSTS